MTRRPNGFTIVELIVVAVLGSMLLLAVLQTLITNQRTYTVQSARIQGQQAMRAAADVLVGEIREISTQGGDLLRMDPTEFNARSMNKFGIVCELTTASPPVLRVTRVGQRFEASDSAFVFADNKTTISSDDTWIRVDVKAVDNTVACGSTPAQDLSFAPSSQGPLFAADSVRVGAPVRGYVHYTYGLISYAGKSFLGRTDASGNTVPLVGPLTASSGLRFVYLDSLGAATTNTLDVRQIQVTIRTSSPVVDARGNPVADSITARVFTRN